MESKEPGNSPSDHKAGQTTLQLVLDWSLRHGVLADKGSMQPPT